MEGVPLSKESCPQLGILDISRYWPNHELLLSRPPRIRRWAGGLEPILALTKLVGQRDQRVILHLVQARFVDWTAHSLHSVGGGRRSVAIISASTTLEQRGIVEVQTNVLLLSTQKVVGGVVVVKYLLVMSG